MDQEDLRYLDGSQQQLYIASMKRVQTDEWKELVEWCKEEHVKATGRELVANKWEDILLARGEKRAYENIINLESDLINQFNALVDEAKGQELAKDEMEHE